MDVPGAAGAPREWRPAARFHRWATRRRPRPVGANGTLADDNRSAERRRIAVAREHHASPPASATIRARMLTPVASCPTTKGDAATNGPTENARRMGSGTSRRRSPRPGLHARNASVSSRPASKITSRGVPTTPPMLLMCRVVELGMASPTIATGVILPPRA